MVDSMQDRINYFENSLRIQDDIARSENERLKLEIELNKMINSDEAM